MDGTQRKQQLIDHVIAHGMIEPIPGADTYRITPEMEELSDLLDDEDAATQDAGCS